MELIRSKVSERSRIAGEYIAERINAIAWLMFSHMIFKSGGYRDKSCECCNEYCDGYYINMVSFVSITANSFSIRLCKFCYDKIKLMNEFIMEKYITLLLIANLPIIDDIKTRFCADYFDLLKPRRGLKGISLMEAYENDIYCYDITAEMAQVSVIHNLIIYRTGCDEHICICCLEDDADYIITNEKLYICYRCYKDIDLRQRWFRREMVHKLLLITELTPEISPRFREIYFDLFA
jgi:hypothetical protein